MSKSTPQLVNKLREGLQDTVVFLRTLGSYKIPAVIERRRKELLDRLCLLQGDTLKDPPPVIDPSEEKHAKEPTSAVPREPTSAVSRDDREDSPSSTASSTSGVTSPTRQITRRNSKVVTGLISNFEVKHSIAKKEEEDETPKRMFQLKKVAKPSDFPATAKEDGENPKEQTDSKSAADKSVDKPAESAGAKKDMLEVDDGGRERASSVASSAGEEEEEDEEESKDKKKKKKNKKGLFKGKSKKGDKSPLPERKDISPEEKYPLPDKKTPAPEQQDQEEEMELAEGVKICGVLERKQKKIGGSKKVKIDAKVFNTMLILGGKEELELAHCSVEETDTGFKLTHPQHKSVMPFKVDGGEEEKQRWVVVLREAIAEATPAKEDKEEAVAEPAKESPHHEAVPSITVEEVAAQPNKANKRDSKALGGTKPEKKLPDQGVALKGYIHRKKPGLGRNWEKTYCVLTYQAMYFTTVEDNREYSSMLPIYPDTDCKLSETKKGKGHDKHCQAQGLTLKMGKKLEHFSFESQTDWKDWKDAIERVLGLGGVEELLSEDEDHGDLIEEDLYEELETDFIPPVPSSPRPSHQGFPPVSQEDDIIIDEDIYEDTDDYLPTISASPTHAPGPTLPGRNPTSSPAPALPGRNPTSPAPALPGRNPTPSPAPALPGRNPTSAPAPALPGRNPTSSSVPAPALPGRNPTPSKGANIPARPTKPGLSPLEKKSVAKAPAPPPTAGDDELYDDVVVETAEVEEMYDDVVIGEGGGAVEEEMYDDVVVEGGGAVEEELYDDVVTTSGVEQDEFYEDMVPGKSPDPYVTLEKKGGAEPDEGDDLYVDVDEPPKPQKPAASKSGTFSRMLNKKTGKTPGAMSGAVSYKAPKKSKFDSKWAVISGSSLLIHKSASDKKSQDKIPLGECKLEYGSTEAGAGKFAFHLSKGDKVYHLSFKEAGELEEWLGVVKGLVKYAPVDAGDQEVYVAKEDHIGDSDQEITFKKGTYIRLISVLSPKLWVGQIGTEDQVFEGKTGKFPAHKVELAEDLYM